MAITLDSIDVYFVGNPSGKFSSYPSGLDSTFFDNNISKEQSDVYIIKSDRSIGCYTFFNLTPSKNNLSAKKGQYFGIIIELKGYKLNFEGQQKINQFFEKYVNEVRYQSTIFERSSEGFYQINKFNDVDTYLKKIIGTIKIVFKEEFGKYLHKTILKSKKEYKEEKKKINRDMNFKPKINSIFLISLLIAILTFLCIEYICKSLYPTYKFIEHLVYFSYSLVVLYLIIALHKFSKLKSKSKSKTKKIRKGRFAAITTLIAFLIGIYAFQKDIMKQSKNWQESIVYSIKPFNLEFKHQESSTDVILCIDISGSSDEDIINDTDIPEWFSEIKKNTLFFSGLGLRLDDNYVKKIIDDKVTEFDLIKLKALKIIKESNENIHLVVFGDESNEINFAFEKNIKKRKEIICKEIIKLKNNDLNTNFKELFNNINNIIIDNDIKHPDFYNITILSDFIKDVDKNFSISIELLDSFSSLIELEVPVFFNFLFFETKPKPEIKKYYHNEKDVNKEKCLFCSIKNKLNSKEGFYYKKINRDSFNIKLVNYIINEKELNFYYTDIYNYTSLACISLESNAYDNFGFWITQNKKNKSGKLQFRYKNKSVTQKFQNINLLKKKKIPLQKNRDIELSHYSEFPNINNYRDLFIHIEDYGNNTIHVSKIKFSDKIDNTMVKLILSIMVCLFFLSLNYLFFEIISDFIIPLWNKLF